MTIMTNMVDPASVLPRKVTTVPKDVILTFKHSKKVGHYLLGKTIGEGSFAKVKEAMHILTGEKVSGFYTTYKYKSFVKKERNVVFKCNQCVINVYIRLNLDNSRLSLRFSQFSGC